MEAYLYNRGAGERATAQVTGFLAVLALALAAVGTYGVMAVQRGAAVARNRHPNGARGHRRERFQYGVAGRRRAGRRSGCCSAAFRRLTAQCVCCGRSIPASTQATARPMWEWQRSCLPSRWRLARCPPASDARERDHCAARRVAAAQSRVMATTDDKGAPPTSLQYKRAADGVITGGRTRSVCCADPCT